MLVPCLVQNSKVVMLLKNQVKEIEITTEDDSKRPERALQFFRNIKRIDSVRGSNALSVIIAVMVDFSSFIFLFSTYMYSFTDQ